MPSAMSATRKLTSSVSMASSHQITPLLSSPATRESTRRTSTDLSCKVYVGGLGKGATLAEVSEAFALFGRLRVPVWVARYPAGFAFAEFERPEDAEAAVRGLDGTIMNGRRVRVERSSGESRWEKWKIRPPTFLESSNGGGHVEVVKYAAILQRARRGSDSGRKKYRRVSRNSSRSRSSKHHHSSDSGSISTTRLTRSTSKRLKSESRFISWSPSGRSHQNRYDDGRSTSSSANRKYQVASRSKIPSLLDKKFAKRPVLTTSQGIVKRCVSSMRLTNAREMLNSRVSTQKLSSNSQISNQLAAYREPSSTGGPTNPAHRVERIQSQYKTSLTTKYTSMIQRRKNISDWLNSSTATRLRPIPYKTQRAIIESESKSSKFRDHGRRARRDRFTTYRSDTRSDSSKSRSESKHSQGFFFRKNSKGSTQTTSKRTDYRLSISKPHSNKLNTIHSKNEEPGKNFEKRTSNESVVDLREKKRRSCSTSRHRTNISSKNNDDLTLTLEKTTIEKLEKKSNIAGDKKQAVHRSLERTERLIVKKRKADSILRYKRSKKSRSSSRKSSWRSSSSRSRSFSSSGSSICSSSYHNTKLHTSHVAEKLIPLSRKPETDQSKSGRGITLSDQVDSQPGVSATYENASDAAANTDALSPVGLSSSRMLSIPDASAAMQLIESESSSVLVSSSVWSAKNWTIDAVASTSCSSAVAKKSSRTMKLTRMISTVSDTTGVVESTTSAEFVDVKNSSTAFTSDVYVSATSCSERPNSELYADIPEIQSPGVKESTVDIPVDTTLANTIDVRTHPPSCVDTDHMTSHGGQELLNVQTQTDFSMSSTVLKSTSTRSIAIQCTI